MGSRDSETVTTIWVEETLQALYCIRLSCMPSSP